MSTTLTLKGQVTIPKHIRDALGLMPGAQLDFAVNSQGEVILQKAAANTVSSKDRFELARGKAQIKWKTKDLMKLLRSPD
jgi:AbrB family looped-hinge helix DNA binding protein